MMLPDQSYMMKVGELRYIQSMYEAPEFRNPDALIREFLPPLRRWVCMLKAKMQLSRLQANPFYYYILARTIYYDQVFIDATRSNIKYIINIGCGSDTRAYRFAQILKQNEVNVLECDQPQSISIKQLLAQRKWRTDQITYVSIDLNEGSWPDLERRLAEIPSTVLVMLEGVSPYVDEESFYRFLNFIAANVHAGSRLAYDYKIRGVADNFGHVGRTKKPFRLPSTKQSVMAWHEALGYKLEHIELSCDLSSRLLPNLVKSGARLFAEDCLLKLTVV